MGSEARYQSLRSYPPTGRAGTRDKAEGEAVNRKFAGASLNKLVDDWLRARSGLCFCTDCVADGVALPRPRTIAALNRLAVAYCSRYPGSARAVGRSLRSQCLGRSKDGRQGAIGPEQ